MRNYNNLNGFSLIELMIVIAIIGILAAIAIPSYKNYILKANISKLITQAQPGQNAINEYTQTTGDFNCTNFQLVNTVTPTSNGFQQVAYGNTGGYLSGPVSCMSMTALLGFNDSANDLFSIGSVATSSGDGGMSWNCAYVYFSASGPTTSLTSSQLNELVPHGCVDYSSIALH